MAMRSVKENENRTSAAIIPLKLFPLNGRCLKSLIMLHSKALCFNSSP